MLRLQALSAIRSLGEFGAKIAFHVCVVGSTKFREEKDMAKKLGGKKLEKKAPLKKPGR